MLLLFFYPSFCRNIPCLKLNHRPWKLWICRAFQPPRFCRRASAGRRGRKGLILCWVLALQWLAQAGHDVEHMMLPFFREMPLKYKSWIYPPARMHPSPPGWHDICISLSLLVHLYRIGNPNLNLYLPASWVGGRSNTNLQHQLQQFSRWWFQPIWNIS